MCVCECVCLRRVCCRKPWRWPRLTLCPRCLGSSSVPDIREEGKEWVGRAWPWAEPQKGHAQGKCHPSKGAASTRPRLHCAPGAVITALSLFSRPGFPVVSPDSTSTPALTPTPVWLPPPALYFMLLGDRCWVPLRTSSPLLAFSSFLLLTHFATSSCEIKSKTISGRYSPP